MTVNVEQKLEPAPVPRIVAGLPIEERRQRLVGTAAHPSQQRRHRTLRQPLAALGGLRPQDRGLLPLSCDQTVDQLLGPFALPVILEIDGSGLEDPDRRRGDRIALARHHQTPVLAVEDLRLLQTLDPLALLDRFVAAVGVAPLRIGAEVRLPHQHPLHALLKLEHPVENVPVGMQYRILGRGEHRHHLGRRQLRLFHPPRKPAHPVERPQHVVAEVARGQRIEQRRVDPAHELDPFLHAPAHQPEHARQPVDPAEKNAVEGIAGHGARRSQERVPLRPRELQPPAQHRAQMTRLALAFEVADPHRVGRLLAHAARHLRRVRAEQRPHQARLAAALAVVVVDPAQQRRELVDADPVALPPLHVVRQHVERRAVAEQRPAIVGRMPVERGLQQPVQTVEGKPRAPLEADDDVLKLVLAHHERPPAPALLAPAAGPVAPVRVLA